MAGGRPVVGLAPQRSATGRPVVGLAPAAGTGTKAAPAKKSGGGLLHSIAKYSGAELVGNLAKDVGRTAVGIGPGLYQVGKAVAHDTAYYATGSGFRGKNPHGGEHVLNEVGQPLVQSYKDYYGHDVPHHLYTHPLQPILDALTIASAGAGAAAKAGKVAADVGMISKESQLAKLGERAVVRTRSPRNIATGGKGPVHEDITSTKPLVKTRETTAAKARAARPEGVPLRPGGEPRVGGELKRYGKQIQAEANQGALKRLQHIEPYQKATRRLSPNEWTALHIRAMDIHPSDLAELWKGTPAEKVVTDGRIRGLVVSPSKRMQAAEPELRKLSQAGEQLYKQQRLLKEDTASARPDLTKRQASALLERPVREIHGQPYYFPHTIEPPKNVSPLAAAGGGKALPRKLGSTKENTGALALHGKLHLRSDVLGPEFLRRVKYVKYDEIHNALRRGAVRVTRQQIEHDYGGKLPKGWEYLRQKASTRIPPTIRGEGEQHVPIGSLGRTPEASPSAAPAARQLPIPVSNPSGLTESAVTARLRILDQRYREILAKFVPEVSPYGGKLSQREQLSRNFENTRPRARIKPTVKNEELRLAEDKLHQLLATHPDNPAVAQAAKLIAEREQLRGALNARAEASMAGDTMPTLSKLIPNPENLHDSQLAKEGFSTTDAAQAHTSGQHFYIVPKSTVRAATGEFTRSSDFTNAFVKRPLSVWRAAVLGLRVGFLTNNLIGNSIMYAAKTGGQGALRDLFMAIKESHGRDVARKILDDPATPPKLRGDLYKEFFPEQIQGTFGRTQTPAVSAAHVAAGKAAEGYRAATGAIPRLTSKVAEEYPRRALIRHYIRHSPEFKRVYQQLPVDTRNFEEAARRVLAGEGPRYQRMISRQVNQALGDYMHLTPFERNVMRNAFPFYSWYRAITTTSYHLAADTPGRANALAIIGRIGSDASSKELGQVPSFLKGAIPLGPGKGGTKKVLTTQGLNPYATLPQLGSGITSDVGSLGINPFLLAGAQAYAKATAHGGKVSAPKIAETALLAMLQGLPPSRLAHPLPPSKLYPNRNRRSELLSFLGAPVKEYNPNVAAQQAGQGR